MYVLCKAGAMRELDLQEIYWGKCLSRLKKEEQEKAREGFQTMIQQGHLGEEEGKEGGMGKNHLRLYAVLRKFQPG